MWLFDWFGYWPEWFEYMYPGIWVSLQLTGLVMLFSLPIGLLWGVMAESRFKVLKVISFLFVEIGRGLPALVLLYLLYYSLPSVGIVMMSMETAVISLSWTTAAYASEYFRAGLAAVPKGQREAALATGMKPWDGFRYVILPETLRISTPPVTGLAVLTFQASALAFIIAVPELMSKAYELTSATFRYLGIYSFTAVIYAVITLIFLWLVRLFEKRLNRHL